VDNSRSAGHAWGPRTAHDISLLRVRVDKGGINEEEFGTFMHELGHCTEQVLTAFEMDYKSLWSVPNTAFTEGFAFTFQDKADFILGRKTTLDADITVLQRFWEVFEITGPALTEIRFFHWLYANPNATAEDMHRAIRRIGDEVWAQFYARIFGKEGHGLMSVYSHMLWCSFYLADYSMGYVIAYQVRKYLATRKFAPEMERLCALGCIYPEQWMKAAVGQSISAAPLLEDVKKAAKRAVK
jgi:oligoendopeptidase F